ncbi:hypothetical protein HQ560_01750 [bacterium]|nr:hypothetical protein [bacterium]
MKRRDFRKTTNLRTPLGLALALALAVASAAAAGQGAEPARKTTTIAALPFRLAAPDERYALLAEAFGDLLMARLATVEGLVFVERSALDTVLAELDRTALMAPAEQARLGRMLGATFLLTGSLTAAGERLQIHAHLLEVATTRVARSAKATARADRVVEAVEALSRQLAERLDLDLPTLTPEQIDRSPEANLHFMRGLGHYFAGMPDHAIACFMKALASDPTHARARFWNGKTYFEQDERAHARIELDRFLEQFPKHPFVPQAQSMVTRCADTTDKKTGARP